MVEGDLLPPCQHIEFPAEEASWESEDWHLQIWDEHHSGVSWDIQFLFQLCMLHHRSQCSPLVRGEMADVEWK